MIKKSLRDSGRLLKQSNIKSLVFENSDKLRIFIEDKLIFVSLNFYPNNVDFSNKFAVARILLFKRAVLHGLITGIA